MHTKSGVGGGTAYYSSLGYGIQFGIIGAFLLIAGGLFAVDALEGAWGRPAKYICSLFALLALLGGFTTPRGFWWLDGDRLRFERLLGPVEISVHHLVAVETKGQEGGVLFRYRRPGQKGLEVVALSSVPPNWDEFLDRVARANPYVDLHNA